MKRKPDPTFKIVIVGPSGTGKTTLVNAITTDDKDFQPSPTTTAIISSHKITAHNGRVLTCHFWDTAGQERYKALGTMYYKNSFACLAVANVTEPDTLDQLEDYIRMYEDECAGESIVFIVLNKIDELEDNESLVGIIERAETLGRHVIPVSAKTRNGVDVLVDNMASAIVSATEQEEEYVEEPEGQDLTTTGDNPKKKCC